MRARILRVVLRLGVLTCAVLMFSGTAAAQSEDDASDQPSELVTPPKLVRFVEADYPEAEKVLGKEATVELALSIGADGRVTEVEVLESAGEAFDLAAAAAARQFIFEPARRDWEPVPAKIRYRYVFELNPPETEVTTGWLSGIVLFAKDETPAVGMTIEIASKDRRVVRDFVTGKDGSFVATDLEPGTYTVTVFGQDVEQVRNEEEIIAGQATEVIYRLGARKGTEVYEGFGATAVIEPPPREVVKRTLSAAELSRIPGTRGDALRAIEILPGVARPPLGLGLLIIRGSAPGDSETFVEGIPVPLLYHFGGLTSVINSRLLQQIDFVPGNFSTRFGRRTGGIIEVKLRDPAEDRFHGIAEINVIDAYVLAEGPISDKVGVAAAARRSLIDLVFPALAPDDIGVVAAPVYYDYQFLLTYKPSNRDRLRLFAYGSNDRFELLFEETLGDDPAIRGNASLLTRFNYVQLDWDRKISPDIEQELDIQSGVIRLDLQLQDEFLFEGTFYQTYARGEWRARITDAVSITGGFDLFLSPSRIVFRGPQPQQTEGAGSQAQPLAGQPEVFVDTFQTFVRPGVYLESELKLGNFTTLILGTRLDYFSEIDRFAFDPRATTVFQVRDDMRVSLGVGIYSQAPEFQESNEDIGNPNLKPIRSLHVGAGYEIDPLPGMTFGVEGFYKHLWDRVIATPNGEEPFFITGGVGRIYGAEFAAQIRPTEGEGEGSRRWFGYLSYTLSRSERRDGPGEPWRLFDFDQTHILTLSFIYRFPRRWEIGGTFRLVSGNPQTPVVGSVYDALNDVYIPIDGRINSIRDPLFHRLDVRIEKQWKFNRWLLALFLDIQNVYNQQNREGILYNFDFSESTPLTGLPIIPALGLRGEL